MKQVTADIISVFSTIYQLDVSYVQHEWICLSRVILWHYWLVARVVSWALLPVWYEKLSILQIFSSHLKMTAQVLTALTAHEVLHISLLPFVISTLMIFRWFRAILLKIWMNNRPFYCYCWGMFKKKMWCN